MKPVVIVGALAVCLLIAAYTVLTANSQEGTDMQTAQDASTLPVLFTAPELTNTVWLNTDAPLRLADLRGNVVGLEMWTFDCYNCQNVMPYLKQWHSTYKDSGFVLIGNHYPEFQFEADLDNLKAAVSRFDLQYAIAVDNDRTTWDAYGTSAWPTLYLIDKWGNVRYRQVGEGRYKQTEAAIQSLLAEEYP
jgi:thiol-disulfide isomerase/thioredoxin